MGSEDGRAAASNDGERVVRIEVPPGAIVEVRTTDDTLPRFRFTAPDLAGRLLLELSREAPPAEAAPAAAEAEPAASGRGRGPKGP